MPLSFLLIGIAWEEISTLVGAEKAPGMIEMVKGAIAKDEARFIAWGLKYEFVPYGSSEDMGRLESMLKEKKYDGVCIGFGIRGTKDFTALFERLVNTISTTLPSARLLFNVSPDGTLDAARRQFPDIPQAKAEAAE